MSRQDSSRGVNIQVLLRCRPTNEEEKKRNTPKVVVCNEARKEVSVGTIVAGKTSQRTFTFDKVFGPDSAQETVYREGVQPIVQEVMEGYSCTVFAYGQTGTGKTHTMAGDLTRSQIGELPAGAGIIPRAVKHIFDTLERQYTEYSVKVTYLELYNEEITDLLAPEGEAVQKGTEKKGLPLLEGSDGAVHVKGLEEEIVKSTDDIFRVLNRGSNRRRTAATDLNALSSRSHSIFSIIIHMKETTAEGEELIKCGKLNLVDLAGSENVGRSGAKDTRAREAGEINKSLLTLSRVITSLVEHQPFVPYRDSKLTRLLRDSLGGKTKTCILATVAPTVTCQEETIRTLDYAQKAKSIRNTPQANQRVTKQALLRELTSEIDRLRAELLATRERTGVFRPKDVFEQEQAELVELRARLSSQAQDIMARLEESTKQAQELANERAAKEKFRRELESTMATLEETSAELDAARRTIAEQTATLAKREETIRQLQAAEESLARMSFQIRTDYDGVSSDVHGLFQKLERLSQLESENETLRQQLAEDMEGRKAEMVKSVAGIQESIRKAEDGTRAAVSALGERQVQVAASQQESLKALGALVSQGMDSIEKVVRQYHGTASAQLEGISSSTVAFLDGTLQTLSEAKGVTAAAQKELVASMTELGASMGSMGSAWEKMASELNASAEQLESSYREGMARMSAECKAAERRLETNAEEIRDMGRDLVATLKEHQEVGIQKAIECLQNMASTNNTKMEGYISALGSRLEVTKSNAAKMVTGVERAAQDVAARTEEISQARRAASAAHLEQLSELRIKAEASMQSTSTGILAFSQPHEKAISAVTVNASAHKAETSQAILQAQAAAGSLTAHVSSSGQACSASVAEQQEKVASSVAEGAQALASDLANASEANQAACESVVTEAGKLSGEVERALDAVVAFKAKKYMPSQGTPKKRALETVTQGEIEGARFRPAPGDADASHMPSPAKMMRKGVDAPMDRSVLGDVSNKTSPSKPRGSPSTTATVAVKVSPLKGSPRALPRRRI